MVGGKRLGDGDGEARGRGRIKYRQGGMTYPRERLLWTRRRCYTFLRRALPRSLIHSRPSSSREWSVEQVSRSEPVCTLCFSCLYAHLPVLWVSPGSWHVCVQSPGNPPCGLFVRPNSPACT